MQTCSVLSQSGVSTPEIRTELRYCWKGFTPREDLKMKYEIIDVRSDKQQRGLVNLLDRTHVLPEVSVHL